jgi:hypothetical protein
MLDLALRRTLSDSEHKHRRNPKRTYLDKAYYELALKLQNQCRKTALAAAHLKRMAAATAPQKTDGTD